MTFDVESLRRELENITATDAREIELDVSKIKKELKDVRQQLQELHSTRGALIARLEEFKRVEAEQESLLAERAPLAADLTLYQQLGTAFSKNGIPALIIENAIPELERISNEILGEMSQGKHSLRFDTQRELKSRAGVAETLDIIVSDWAGSRPYETFSGGEQLRIDFAIRFALAELLSRRAGSKIEWLVVDEGLGSQDREHRELVLEAIKNVANRFKKVFVITHIEEAQEAFPSQIRFERSDTGVEVEVV
jgi:exonuclease SbcC